MRLRSVMFLETSSALRASPSLVEAGRPMDSIGMVDYTWLESGAELRRISAVRLLQLDSSVRLLQLDSSVRFQMVGTW